MDKEECREFNAQLMGAMGPERLKIGVCWPDGTFITHRVKGIVMDRNVTTGQVFISFITCSGERKKMNFEKSYWDEED